MIIKMFSIIITLLVLLLILALYCVYNITHPEYIKPADNPDTPEDKFSPQKRRTFKSKFYKKYLEIKKRIRKNQKKSKFSEKAEYTESNDKLINNDENYQIGDNIYFNKSRYKSSEDNLYDSDFYSGSDELDSSSDFLSIFSLKNKCKSNIFLNKLFVPTLISKDFFDKLFIDDRITSIEEKIRNFMKKYEELYKYSVYNLQIEDIEIIKKSVFNLYLIYLNNLLEDLCKDEESDEFLNINCRNILNKIRINIEEDLYKLIDECIDLIIYQTNKYYKLIYGIFIADIIKILEMKSFTNLFDILILHNSLVIRLAEQELGLVNYFKFRILENASFNKELEFMQLPYIDLHEDTQLFINFNNINLDIILTLYASLGIIKIDCRNPGICRHPFLANQKLFRKYIFNLQKISLVDREYLNFIFEIYENINDINIS